MAQLLCQKCRTPLELDGSLHHLNPASFKILADAAPLLDIQAPSSPQSVDAQERLQHYKEVVSSTAAPPNRRTLSSEQWKRSSPATDQSYVVLPESQATKAKPSESHGKSVAKQHENGPVSFEHMEMATRLFEILSARSDIDHPICTECTEIVLDGLQKRQHNVIRERDAYIQFLKQAEQDVPTDEEVKRSQAALSDVLRREREAMKELELLEAEKLRMEDEIAALDAESELLDEEEEKYWRMRNAHTAELAAFQEERNSLQNQLAHDNKLLESLQRTNVYNDTFCIGHDGNFVTINGLRLGRLPDYPVDWAEINAAWGQALLLLVVLAEKLNCTLSGWKLHPMGSTSKIEKLETLPATSAGSTNGKQKGAMLELYSSGDVPLSFGFLHRSFDSGMVAYLDCVRQLGEHVERSSTGLRMPYKISRDKIGDMSIKLGHFGQETDWTKACKFTLTCCKFLLAHASHKDDPRTSKTGRLNEESGRVRHM
ncbi:hypothetical protein AMS68_000839 [Peltaster fructicola]|uniref:Uncharacterized protein n=1 Tax=Peltaster fructicola TaxID=286661 RepID=A0A6H0XKQ7_9PEZI|nr:hypothetical protein AMS68_000839 [Peltaster fructicola]